MAAFLFWKASEKEKMVITWSFPALHSWAGGLRRWERGHRLHSQELQSGLSSRTLVPWKQCQILMNICMSPVQPSLLEEYFVWMRSPHLVWLDEQHLCHVIRVGPNLKFARLEKKVFSCPQQLNRWPCPLLALSVCLLPLTIRVFTTLQSEP